MCVIIWTARAWPLGTLAEERADCFPLADCYKQPAVEGDLWTIPTYSSAVSGAINRRSCDLTQLAFGATKQNNMWPVMWRLMGANSASFMQINKVSFVWMFILSNNPTSLALNGKNHRRKTLSQSRGLRRNSCFCWRLCNVGCAHAQ